MDLGFVLQVGLKVAPPHQHGLGLQGVLQPIRRMYAEDLWFVAAPPLDRKACSW